MTGIEFSENEVATQRHKDTVRFLKKNDTTIRDLESRYQNRYGAREALHVAHMLEENVDSYLLDHPVVLLDQEAYSFAHIASTALFNLYQRIGELEEAFRQAEEGQK